MTRQEKVNLLNELLGIEEKNDIGNLTSTDRREFQQWVEELKQEPKTGHWDEVFNYIEGEVRFYCSECNDYQMFTSRYCPNCGCRMF